MSHFTVGVLLPKGINITNDTAIENKVEELLMPYHEFECTGIDEYIEDIDETDNYIEQYLTGESERIILADGSLKHTYDDMFSRPATQEEIDLIKTAKEKYSFDASKHVPFEYSHSYVDNKERYSITNVYPEGSRKETIPYRKFITFREYISDDFHIIDMDKEPDTSDKDKYGYVIQLAEDNWESEVNLDNDSIYGNVANADIKRYLKSVYECIRRTNPNSKWDWYTVGGRWDGCLKLKNGKESNCSYIKNIDFSLNKDTYDKAIRYWEVVIEGSPLKENEKKEDFFNFYKKEYYIEHYGTKEKYALDQATFYTYAFVDDDGKWYEKGEVGWFGCGSDTKESTDDYLNLFSRKIINADENNIFVVVDCHI